jgi:hypothetical protein
LRQWLLGLAVVTTAALTDASTQVFMAGPGAPMFLGFRVLDLDGTLVQWGSPRRSGTVTVTYAFAQRSARYDRARNCQAMDPVDGLLARSALSFEALRREARIAFSMWEAVADIRFHEVADPAEAGILIGAQSEPQGHAFADVRYVPGESPWGRIERSLICLNPEKRWKIGFDGNLRVYDLRYTLAHEIGHAIGLDHPEPGGQLMSARYGEQFRTLQDGDVRGAIQLYGPRPSL